MLTMKAVACLRYGVPEKVLVCQEVARPNPSQGEVLVRICASAVNDYDWAMVRGRPYLYRLIFGIFRPKRLGLGMEMAGVVEECGAGATRFRPGDAVYGDTSDHGFGTFAEYIAISEEALTLKPNEIDFTEAAATAHAAGLALQGLRDVGGIKSGERVLINGAGGGVGMFGVQLAKLNQCEVTGVDSRGKFEAMRQIGFDHLIDYKTEDFTKNGQQYDLILDAKTTRPPRAYLRSLRPGGRYVTVGGRAGRLLQIAFFGALLSRVFKRQLRVVVLKSNMGLSYINELFVAGKIRCVIDGPYHSLDEVGQAIRHFGEARHNGKVVVQVDFPTKNTRRTRG